MIELWRELFLPEMGFLRCAMLLGVLLAPVLGVTGTMVVTRRISSLAGASAHAALGGIGLALYLQRAVTAAWPTLMRPVDLVPQRYNQHLSSGMLILEVGSDGNTLQEALAAVRLFGRATAPALLALTEED